MTTDLVKSKAHSDPSRWVVIYPAYLNAKKTLEQGRKIPKDLAIENPTIQEIFDIIQSLGLKVNAERKMFPRELDREWSVQGRVRVQLKNDDGSPVDKEIPSRMALYRKVVEMIPKLKSRQGGVGATTVPATAVAGPSTGGGGGTTNKKNKKKK